MLNAERLPRDIIAIGGSAGGLQALLRLLEVLPGDLPAALLVVLHRHPHFESALLEILGKRAALAVREPSDREPLRQSHVYIAPRDQHMVVAGDRLHLNREPKQHWMRPAVDPLFVSAAEAYGARVAGVLLSGGGSDGVRGLAAIKVAGGLSLVQDPREARHPTMPIRAIRDDDVDAVLDVDGLARALGALARGEAVNGAGTRVAASSGAGPSETPGGARLARKADGLDAERA